MVMLAYSCAATKPPCGDQRRDRALAGLRARNPDLARRIQRRFLLILLARDATTDAVREVVPIPAGANPKIVGAAVRALAGLGLIRSVGRAKSRRAAAHARTIEVWSIADELTVFNWLAVNDEPAGAEGVNDGR